MKTEHWVREYGLSTEKTECWWFSHYQAEYVKTETMTVIVFTVMPENALRNKLCIILDNICISCD